MYVDNNSFNDFIVERLNKIDIVEKYSSLRFDICKNISNGINDSKQYFEIAKDIIKIMESYCLDEELDYVYIDLISLLDDEESIRKYVGNIRKMAISSEKRMNKNLWTIYSIKGRKNKNLTKLCMEMLPVEFKVQKGILFEREDRRDLKLSFIENDIYDWVTKAYAVCTLENNDPEKSRYLIAYMVKCMMDLENHSFLYYTLKSAYNSTVNKLDNKQNPSL